MSTELSRQKFQDLRAILERGRPQLELAMAEHMSSERLIRLALTAATHNPKLLDCTQESIGLSLLTASQLGIEPNGRDGHLVPYKTTCQFLPDYKGLVKLATGAPTRCSPTVGASVEAFIPYGMTTAFASSQRMTTRPRSSASDLRMTGASPTSSWFRACRSTRPSARL